VLVRNIIFPVTFFGSAGLAIFLGFQASGIGWAYVVAYGVAASAGMFYIVRETPLLDMGAAKEPMHWDLLSFSVPMMITAVMQMMFRNLDLFILGYFFESRVVGIYNVSYELGNLITLGLSALGFLFMPLLSELHASNDTREMKEIYGISTKWVFFSSLPLVLLSILRPEFLITFIFGHQYISGSHALSILAIGFLIHGIAGFNGHTLTSIGKTNIIMVDTVVVAILNIILNFVLIPRYSFVGAAIATTLSYAILNLLFSYQLYNRTGIHPFSSTLIRYCILPMLAFSAAIFSVDSLLFLRDFIVVGLIFVYLFFNIGLIIRLGGVSPREFLLASQVLQRVNSVTDGRYRR
jgi:O-antigen/teichoic acid export membrane protein